MEASCKQRLTHQHGPPPVRLSSSAPPRALPRFTAMRLARDSRAVPPITSWQSSVACSVTAAIEILVELAAELAQFIQAQLVQFHALFQRKANRVADLLVRRAEGNALVHEVGRRGHRIQIARLRRLAHALAIELQVPP